MNFVFTDKPPQHWNELCRNQGDLFNTPEWHGVLAKGFGSETLYGWDEASSIGITITIFKAGPFRIGYLGFPVGGTVGGATISPAMIETLKKTEFPNTIHCIRIPVSAFAEDDDLPLSAQVTLETAIGNLQEWRPQINRRLHRDVKKAERSPLRVVDATESSQGRSFFHLYRDTVSRHHGSMRYTLSYFCELINLARVSPRLRCLLAMTGDKVAGFLVVVCHHKTAYYLHGGMDPELKRYTPSDLLLYEAINWGKQQGMTCFTMMASPSNQATLIRYKEKWGCITREQRTYDLALQPFQTMIFRGAARIYQSLSGFQKGF